MPETIPDLLRHAASQYGRREFLRFPDTSLTFEDADVQSDRLAGALIDKGVRPGDRVAIMMDNVPGWPLSWLAILKAGAIAVPVNVRYRAADLEHVLRDSGAVATLTTAEHAPHIPGTVHTLDSLSGSPPTRPVPINSKDVANFQYTSGTTGFPKACMLTHDYWLRTAQIVADQARLRDDDVMLMAQAYSYMDPQWATLLCLIGGIPLVVLPRFSASGFWPAAREHGATLTYVLGTMPLLLHKQPPHPHDRENRMRLVLCSGIRPDLHREFEERWGAPWRELYGSTESGPDLYVDIDAEETVGTGAMGRPPAGKEVVIDEETGEILVRGVPMMNGYWNHPEATAKAFRDGWYHTGDLGFRDAHGYIHHAGRIKDMVRRGGENISCAEVESVLTQHPAVLQAALVPIPDELWGELPKAFLQLHPGHAPDADTAMSVIEHARKRLARFKIPAYVEFVEGFSLTPSARIEKRHLARPDQRSAPAIAVDQEKK
ncbi:acyl-CoA synthetase (AMP-forming)/AMP-acid ligase II [Nonomuraea polychroma]|uniref:Acyl-CoA synthetase (AMP-forming)/AMP-acid ligase II n=1 Tax=Nonomuraea polychroma TaxID=46176 RepID=A0A438MNH0_9ACTN|nr:AMP-binding protein [Nonomuraea polychroma]RVX47290.1 acyl-CoA synthetase (AMP-forming)/AMP-acid ligase II [Nonomuraea polychroma]